MTSPYRNINEDDIEECIYESDNTLGSQDSYSSDFDDEPSSSLRRFIADENEDIDYIEPHDETLNDSIVGNSGDRSELSSVNILRSPRRRNRRIIIPHIAIFDNSDEGSDSDYILNESESTDENFIDESEDEGDSDNVSDISENGSETETESVIIL